MAPHNCDMSRFPASAISDAPFLLATAWITKLPLDRLA